jgi:hypothetical protein
LKSNLQREDMRIGKLSAIALAAGVAMLSAGHASAALTPESQKFFKGLWDTALIDAYQGDAKLAYAKCSLFMQHWPDPEANKIGQSIGLACATNIREIELGRTPQLPFLY